MRSFNLHALEALSNAMGALLHTSLVYHTLVNYDCPFRTVFDIDSRFCLTMFAHCAQVNYDVSFVLCFHTVPSVLCWTTT